MLEPLSLPEKQIVFGTYKYKFISIAQYLPTRFQQHLKLLHVQYSKDGEGNETILNKTIDANWQPIHI